jgi:hypothetical protein
VEWFERGRSMYRAEWTMGLRVAALDVWMKSLLMLFGVWWMKLASAGAW